MEGVDTYDDWPDMLALPDWTAEVAVLDAVGLPGCTIEAGVPDINEDPDLGGTCSDGPGEELAVVKTAELDTD